MKKKMIFVILTFAILLSLTTGTLAVYTKTISDAEQISAKQFALSAAGDIAGNSTKIILAPTESMEFNFSIANTDANNGQIAEVPLQYDVTIDYAEAFSMMPGLIAILYDGEQTIGVYTDGQIKYTAQSSASVLFEKNYKIVLTWVDDGNSNAQQTAAGSSMLSLNSGLTLTVIATQVLGAAS
jgi:hypothetical protein